MLLQPFSYSLSEFRFCMLIMKLSGFAALNMGTKHPGKLVTCLLDSVLINEPLEMIFGA